MNLIKTEEQIQKIAKASKIVALVHKELKKYIKEGISLLELDEIANKVIEDNDAEPAFKGLEG